MYVAVVLLAIAVIVLASQFRQPAGWVALALSVVALLVTVGVHLHLLG